MYSRITKKNTEDTVAWNYKKTEHTKALKGVLVDFQPLKNIWRLRTNKEYFEPQIAENVRTLSLSKLLLILLIKRV